MALDALRADRRCLDESAEGGRASGGDVGRHRDGAAPGTAASGGSGQPFSSEENVTLRRVRLGSGATTRTAAAPVDTGGGGVGAPLLPAGEWPAAMVGSLFRVETAPSASHGSSVMATTRGPAVTESSDKDGMVRGRGEAAGVAMLLARVWRGSYKPGGGGGWERGDADADQGRGGRRWSVVWCAVGERIGGAMSAAL